MAGAAGRFFVAAPLPQPLKSSLAELQQKLRGQLSQPLRWVKPEGIHLTLKFVGDFELNRLSELETTLARGLAAKPALALALTRLGAFPDARKARVVWVGLEGDIGPLAELAVTCDELTAKLGVTPEQRKFSPHLTLARTFGQEFAYLEELVAKVQVEPLTFQVAEVQLIESKLRPGGSLYKLVRDFPLG